MVKLSRFPSSLSQPQTAQHLPPQEPARASSVQTTAGQPGHPQDAALLHEALKQQCERCLKQAESQQPLSPGDIPLLIESVIDRMQTEDAELIRLAITADPRFTLASHGANVAVLAVRLGMELGMRRSDLVDCGIAALLHDIGMVKVAHLLQAPYPLGHGEITEIRKHPLWGRQIAQRSPQLPAMTRTVIVQEHERADGSGYPGRLTADAIDKHAQLVGLLDVYEALTHNRPYRRLLLPAEACRAITQHHRHAFGRDLLRAFLSAIPVYPLGSWVKLSSGDCAQVVGQSRRYPLSPMVTIRFDRLNQPYPQPETIDLSRHARLAVLQAVTDPTVQWHRSS